MTGGGAINLKESEKEFNDWEDAKRKQLYRKVYTKSY